MTETARIEALRSYQLLDTPPEAVFDRLTTLAADIFDTPIALVSLVDETRQWFKSRHGLQLAETPRSQAFCDHTIRTPLGQVMVVEDARLDARFADNPLVTAENGIRFYAGAKLTSPGGEHLGSLCVIDTAPRARPTERDLKRLETLAGLVVDEFELRRMARVADEKRQLLEMAEAMSSVGSWRFEPASGRIVWSDEVYRIHGVDRSSFDPQLGEAIEFYHPDDRTKVEASLQRAINEGIGFSFQLRLLRRDGDLRYVLCKADISRDVSGTIEAVFGVFQDITESVRSVEVAFESEARYRQLTDNMADVLVRVGDDMKIIFVSPAVRRLLGQPEGAVIGKLAGDVVYVDDWPVMAEAFNALRAAPGVRTFRHRVVHRDGHLLWVETKVQSIPSRNGAPSEVTAVVRDISEQMKLEAAIADSEARYRLLAENSNDIIMRIDRDGTLLYVSPAARRIGIDPDAVIGRSAFLLAAEDRRAVSQSIHADMVHTGVVDPNVSRLHLLTRPDGTEVWLEGSPTLIFGPDGKVSGYVTVMRDVTDRRAAQLAQAESEQRYRNLANTAPDMIAESRIDGTVVYVSPAAFAITGHAPAELVGRTFYSWMHPEDAPRVLDMCRQVFFSRGDVQPWTVEYRARHKQGHEIWLESKPTPVIDPATGRISGFTDVIRDITAHKELQADLAAARVEAEAAAAVKSEFLANMSHEVRTPLTAVLGFSKLVAERTDLPAEAAEHARRVVVAGKALLATVNDILDFSKLEAGQVEIRAEPLALGPMLTEALSLFEEAARAKGLTLSLVQGAMPPALLLDSDRVRQVLLNFIGNAVKFTESGSVQLRADYAETGRLTIAVTDTGPGVPADKLSRLFQRFSQVDGGSTRKHGGTGLGLAICKGLVEAMGGEVGVESAAGAGSTFWLAIPAPRVETAKAVAGGDTEGAVRHLKGVRLLVADDNAMNRRLVAAFLEQLELELHEAVDGAAAVSMASEQPFDAILMDLRMPKLGGVDAAQAIRNGAGPNTEIPIFAFSADAFPDLPLGLFDGIIAKPLAIKAVVDTLSSALGMNEGKPQHAVA